MNESIESKLDELAKLEKNWDSYNGDPIGKGALGVARLVAKAMAGFTIDEPNIVPTSNGGISLEWYRAGREFSLSFRPNGTFDSFFIQGQLGEYYNFESTCEDETPEFISELP